MGSICAWAHAPLACGHAMVSHLMLGELPDVLSRVTPPQLPGWYPPRGRHDRPRSQDAPRLDNGALANHRACSDQDMGLHSAGPKNTVGLNGDMVCDESCWVEPSGDSPMSRSEAVGQNKL